MNLAGLLLTSQASVREVMTTLNANAKGIVLIVDADRRLIGTVTDGDIRRAILASVEVDLPVQVLLDRRATREHPDPLTASAGTADTELLRMMNEHGLRHIPLLDSDGRVVDLVLLSDLVKAYELPLTAVVMAGGFGARLLPLTQDLPKPMLPVGDRPLMHLIIDQLRGAGIRRVNVTTHYQPEKISSYFGDGENFGVELNYVTEANPLGTAGALGLIRASDEPLLVMNGDILARVNFRAMLDYHREHGAEITIAVRQHEMVVPYGVIDAEGPHVRRLREKPVMTALVNAGIYILEPNVVRVIPTDQRFDMTQLIQRLLDDGRSVVMFPIAGYWLDIGKMGDYVQAQEDVKTGRFET